MFLLLFSTGNDNFHYMMDAVSGKDNGRSDIAVIQLISGKSIRNLESNSDSDEFVDTRLSKPMSTINHFNDTGNFEFDLESCIDVQTTALDINKGVSVAAELGNIELVKLFVQHGADFNMTSHCNRMPNGSCCQLDFGSVKDKQIYLEPYMGNNAVMDACREHRMTVVQYLMETGRCDVNVRNDMGNTTLHIASCSEKKVRYDQANKHVAGFHCSLNVVTVLLDHGYDVNARNNLQRTPLIEIFARLVIYGTLSVAEKCNPGLGEISDVIVILIRAGVPQRLSKEENHGVIPLVYLKLLASSPDCVCAMMQSGYKLPSLTNQHRIRLKDINEVTFKLIMIYESTPFTLADLCRIRIKDNLRKPMLKAIQLLPLPNMLKQFLGIASHVHLKGC